MLNRFTFVLAGCVLAILGVGAVIWYLAYEAGPAIPSEIRIESVKDSTELTWRDDGSIDITAANGTDAVTALGFAHATARPWSMFLWRQAALGRVSEWFGPETVPIDRFVRRLGIAAVARETFVDLPDSVRSVLVAYGAGVNAALDETNVRRAAPFVLEKIDPEPWQPWHSLAVEKLLAWIGTPASGLSADPELRALLRTFGFEYNVAAWVATAAEPYMFSRFVTGDSGIPLFVDIRIAGPANRVVTGASMPGVPMFASGIRTPLADSGAAGDAAESAPDAAGATDWTAWSSLLSSTVDIRRTPVPERFGSDRYERIEARTGEFAVRVVTGPDGEILIPSTRDARPPNASVREDAAFTMSVRWSGRMKTTDLPVWLSLTFDDGPRSDPSLFDGGLLLADDAGGSRVLGRPGMRVGSSSGSLSGSFSGNVMIAPDPQDSLEATRTPRQRFTDLVLSQAVAPEAHTLMDDQTSPHREALSTRLLELLSDSLLSPASMDTDRLSEAISYLRNWNGSYAGAEIAPSVLEAYLAVGGEREYAADTTTATAASRLLAALDSLSVRFGSDMSSWRWQRVQNRRLQFPGSSLETTRIAGRFEPVPVEFDGHSSTFRWSPSELILHSGGNGMAGPSAARESALVPGQRLIISRVPSIEWERFLGAYLSSRRPLRIRPVPDPDAVALIHLSILPGVTDE